MRPYFYLYSIYIIIIYTLASSSSSSFFFCLIDFFYAQNILGKNKHKSNLKLNLHTTYVMHVFQTDVAHRGGITQNFEWRLQRASRMMSYLSLERDDKYKMEIREKG